MADLATQGSSSAPPILRAHGLQFAYGSRTIIDGLDLEVTPGEFIGLAGPNGAGKTTLLKLLTGYLVPQAGGVELAGTNMAALNRREAAKQIALVPQQAEVSFPYGVREMVLMGRHPYAGLGFVPTSSDIHAAHDALEQVGIIEFSERRYDRLSGGEQRLVLLARAIAQRAPILLLDEPLSALDLHHQWHVLKLLRQLQSEGTCIVATFHDLNLAAQWCSRLALLDAGRIVANGFPATVLRQDLLTQVYGLPLQVHSGSTAIQVNLPNPP